MSSLGDAVLTGIVGWLLASVFKKGSDVAAPGREPAPSSAPTVPVPPGATAPSPNVVPWPRGETSMPEAKPAQPLRPPGTHEVIQHVVVPSDPRRGGLRPQVFKKTGRAVPQDEEHAMLARERAPFERSYWRPKRKVTALVAARAKALLPEWKQGGVVFDGPRTFSGRVQYRMTKHSGKKAVEAWEPAPPFVA